MTTNNDSSIVATQKQREQAKQDHWRWKPTANRHREFDKIKKANYFFSPAKCYRYGLVWQHHENNENVLAILCKINPGIMT